MTFLPVLGSVKRHRQKMQENPLNLRVFLHLQGFKYTEVSVPHGKKGGCSPFITRSHCPHGIHKDMPCLR